MQKYLIILAIYTISSGCGTMLNRDQIIAFDSQPRGASVYVRDSGEMLYLGKTPLFKETPRLYDHEFIIKLDDQNQKKIDVTCGPRWWGSVLPNGLVAAYTRLVSPFIGGLFFAVDGVTQNMFECEESLMVKFNQFHEESYCKRYLVVPPKAVDANISDFIAEKWQSSFRKKIGPCDVVIFSDESKDEFFYANIDHTSEVQFTDISSRNLFHLANEFSATHMVFLQVLDLDNKYAVNSRVWDVHRKKRYKDIDHLAMIDRPEFNSKIEKSNFFTQYIDLLPNSLVYSGPGLKTEEVYKEGYSLEDKRPRYYVFPEMISFLDVDSIIHPQAYDIWDYKFSISPSFKTAYSNISYKLYDEILASQVEYNQELLYLIPLMNASLILHTPGGAFGFGPSAGLNYVYSKDSLSDSKHRFSFVTGHQYFYYAFISKQVYLMANYQFLKFRQNPVKNRYFFVDKELQSISIGVGYFFPSIRRELSELFTF